MSEYQYYEFQAVDRPLTPEQMAELRTVSSRARITPTSFVNEYNWSDLAADPDRWIERYFDAFMYLANWRTHWLMFRLPSGVLDCETVSPYCCGDKLSCRTKGDDVIVSFYVPDVWGDWDGFQADLSSTVLLRSDLINGDLRCLYLGWLLAVQGGEVDDGEIEPPIPPGLGQLNMQLNNFVEFMNIDPDLISSAAERSPEICEDELSMKDIVQWVSTLSAKDKDDVLVRLIAHEEVHISTELRKCVIRDLYGVEASGADLRSETRRTAGQLVARAELIAEERRRCEAELRAREKAKRERAEARKRKKHLESIVGSENKLWPKVSTLIATRQPKRYDVAVSLLEDLRDLGNMTNTNDEFERRMNELRRTHARKVTLVARLQKAGLLS